jgi:hypothetical protein
LKRSSRETNLDDAGCLSADWPSMWNFAWPVIATSYLRA